MITIFRVRRCAYAESAPELADRHFTSPAINRFIMVGEYIEIAAEDAVNRFDSLSKLDNGTRAVISSRWPSDESASPLAALP